LADCTNDGSPPLLVFADDWGRHPSSCQHLVGQLLDRHEVWWVNTIGMRRPRLDRATLSRGLEKVGHWFRAARRTGQGDFLRPAHPHLHVLNPRMWLSFGSALERRVNRDLLARQLIPVIAAMPEPPIAVTNIPIVADLIGCLPVRRWVYYCVDDFAEWPGLDGTTLRTMEERVVERVDTLVAVSPNLQAKLSRRRQPVHLLSHGVDLERWESGQHATSAVGSFGATENGALADQPNTRDRAPRAGPLVGLERPVIMFWGVVDRRMDVAFLDRLANDLTGGTIVLVGPESDPDPTLARLPRVVRHPAVPFAQLPEIAREARVLIMPYADLAVTRAMQPLKLKEYLATGKPVVVRDLPSTRTWGDALDLAATPEAFSQVVQERIATGLPAPQRRARGRLAEESWIAKARAFERWLIDDDDSPSPRDEKRAHLIEACS
jgi:glycosyltransferase involved in cell wall biosynthesis